MLHVLQRVTPGRYCLVRPEGDLDDRAVSALRCALTDVPGPEGVVIDLSRVAFVDSVGLGPLVGGVRRARDHGTPMAVACARPTLSRILHTTGLDTLVAVIGTLDEATAVVQTHWRQRLQ